MALAGVLIRAGGGPVLLLAGLLAHPLYAQSVAFSRYSLRLADLVIGADTLFGLHVAIVPRGDPGAGGRQAPVWLRFAPDGVLDWVNRAAQALRVPGGGGPARAIQWSPRLAPLGPAGAEGGLLLGRSRRDGSLVRERWLAAADTAPGWQLELSAAEADSVLRLLFALAPQARLDPTAPYEADAVESRATLSFEGRPPRGLALVQYVIGESGRVEPGSLAVLWSSSPRVEREVRDLLLAAGGTSARRGGSAVRQVVRDVLGRP